MTVTNVVYYSSPHLSVLSDVHKQVEIINVSQLTNHKTIVLQIRSFYISVKCSGDGASRTATEIPIILVSRNVTESLCLEIMPAP